MIRFFPGLRHEIFLSSGLSRCSRRRTHARGVSASCPELKLQGWSTASGSEAISISLRAPRRSRVVFGLLDVAGERSENHGIVEAATQTFREKGPACLANDELNEADAMMEFCHELNASIRARPPGCVRAPPSWAATTRNWARSATSMPDIRPDCCVTTPT